MRLLITGFGPFPGVRVNPTARLATRLARRRPGPSPYHASAQVLPVRYDRALAALSQADAREGADAILMLGLAARARFIRVERFGRRSNSPLHPDASGQAGSGPARDSGRPLAATAALHPALAALRRAGLRARLSPSAGRYLCNATYAAQLEAARGRPVIFIHVPWPRPAAGMTPRARLAPWRPVERIAEAALLQLADGLARQARQRCWAASALAPV